MWCRFFQIKFFILIMFCIAQIAICDDFVGRAVELRELQRAVLKNNFVLVTGPSGIGKTTLVKEFSKIYHNRYDFVWWFHEEVNFDENLIKLGYYLGHKYNLQIINAASSMDMNLSRVKAYLLSTRHKILFVFDNFFNFNLITNIPSRSNFVFIVTSLSKLQKVHAMHLDKLPRIHSVELIKRHIDCTSKDANLLAELLHDHPLALTQSIAYIVHTGGTVREYIVLYNDFLDTLWKSEEGLRNAGIIDKTVYSTVSMVLKRLDKESPEAYKLLRYFSVYNKRIPKSVLKNIYLDHISAHEGGFLDILSHLKKYSLLEEDPHDRGYFSCHDGVFNVLKTETNAEQMQVLFKEVMHSCERLLPFFIYESIHNFLSREQDLLNYIDQVVAVAIKARVSSDGLEHLLCNLLEYSIFCSKDYHKALAVIHSLDRYYDVHPLSFSHKSFYHSLKATYYAWHDVNYDLSNVEYKTALDIAESQNQDVLYKIFPQLLLAQNYCYIGELGKAERLLEKVEASLPKNLLPDNTQVNSMAFTAAQIYAIKGDYNRSLAFMGRLSMLTDQKIEPYQVDFWILYGRVLGKTGNSKAGYKILTDIHKSFEKMFGTKSLDTYVTLCIALADLAGEQNKMADMHAYLSEAYGHFSNLYNQEDINQAEYYKLYGDYHFYKKDYENVISWYNQADAIYSRILGNLNRSDIKHLWQQKMKAYMKLGLDHEYAEQLIKYRETFGDKDLEDIIKIAYR